MMNRPTVGYQKEVLFQQPLLVPVQNEWFQQPSQQQETCYQRRLTHYPQSPLKKTEEYNNNVYLRGRNSPPSSQNAKETGAFIQKCLDSVAEEERQLDFEMSQFNQANSNIYHSGDEKWISQKEKFKDRLLSINQKKSVLLKNLWDYHYIDRLQESKGCANVDSPTLDAILTPPSTPAESSDMGPCFDLDLNDLISKPFKTTVKQSDKSIQPKLLDNIIDLTVGDAEEKEVVVEERIDQHIENFFAKEFHLSSEPVALPDASVEVGTNVTLQTDEFNNIVRSEFQRSSKRHVKKENDSNVGTTVSNHLSTSAKTTIKNAATISTVSTEDLPTNNTANKTIGDKDLGRNVQTKAKDVAVEDKFLETVSSTPSGDFEKNNKSSMISKNKSNYKSDYQLMNEGIRTLKKRRQKLKKKLRKLQTKSIQKVKHTSTKTMDGLKTKVTNTNDKTDKKLDRRSKQHSVELPLDILDRRPKQISVTTEKKPQHPSATLSHKKPVQAKLSLFKLGEKRKQNPLKVGQSKGMRMEKKRVRHQDKNMIDDRDNDNNFDDNIFSIFEEFYSDE